MMFDLPQIGLSFLEGLGLAASPCILPVLPFILAASVDKSRVRPFLIIAGFVISFTIFSLIARQILALSGIQQDDIQKGAYVLLLLFGLVMVIPFLEEKFARLTGKFADKAQGLSTGKKADTVLGGLLVGGLIGIVWTPCAGPLLAAALLQVIQAQTSVEAIASIVAFSAGAGIPMLLIAIFGQRLTSKFRALSKHASVIRRTMGVIIILFAVFGLAGFNIGEYVATKTIKTEIVKIDGSALQKGLQQPYAAPEITGITHWFNSESLTMESLKGKVVLVDFWTYSCINCIRTFPYLKDWYAKYKDDGLVILGVHAPEFAFEGQPDNVEKAIQKFGIEYPVAMDNDFKTWGNFKNRYWPAHYLIDKSGQVVYTHFGEGEYNITEGNIRYLLGLGDANDLMATSQPFSDIETPETYLGTKRAAREATGTDLPLHNWKLTGDWARTPQYIKADKEGAALTLHYKARKVFLVMDSEDGKPIDVSITANGQPTQTVDVRAGRATVDISRLYDLLETDAIQEGTMSITADRPGLRLYAFTFES